MYLTKCVADEETNYYGLVGPYGKGGKVLEEDESVFYNLPIADADLEGILEQMIQYVEAQ